MPVTGLQSMPLYSLFTYIQNEGSEVTFYKLFTIHMNKMVVKQPIFESALFTGSYCKMWVLLLFSLA